jgi:hypothetical protein
MAGLAARLALSGDISFAPERPVSGPFAPHFAILSEVSIIPVGDTRATARHPVAGDGPQDCWLSVQWRYGNGAPIGAEQLIGRCRQPIGIAAN